MLTTESIGVAAVLALGLICLKTGRGPLAVLVRWLVHAQAATAAARIGVARGWHSARCSYRECYQQKRREAGQ